MAVATTPDLPTHVITRILGIVTGEAILGANIFSDLFASATDVIGGRSVSYQNKLKDAQRIAIDEMVNDAERLEANAIVGVDLDYETLRGGMLMVCASGTAVKAEPKDQPLVAD